jgi:alpha-glucosidase
MYFNKIDHPLNFRVPDRVDAAAGKLRFGQRAVTLAVTSHADGIFRLEAAGPGWLTSHSQAGLTPPAKAASPWSLGLGRDGTLRLADAAGASLLASVAGVPLAVHEEAWMLRLEPEVGLRFWGMGEKANGEKSWEKKALSTKFWNADVWADHAHERIRNGAVDPLYVSIPYLIIKRGETFIGILVDNPDAVFMGLPRDGEAIASQAFAPGARHFWIGAPTGKPDVWFLVGPTLAELTRKLQRLVGVTPLPPLWALGHHQCRWGYESKKDLVRLDREFRTRGIPCDGLWLDIDYMERFKVFTWDVKHWPHLAKDLAALTAKGRHVVPILDPGVKVEADYPVYEDGLAKGHFCLTAEGQPYTGFVWPGETHFPDFSLPAVRAWWADLTAEFASQGVSGAWLDMNDPSVGPTELGTMRFAKGTLAHGTYHNQYALGMAMASRAGFLAAHPERRPFLLCRSGSTGISRYSALWTGDNYSNWHHLRTAIPVSLNLALSGVPFNGPDVPGFGGDADQALAVAWYKAGFLFPVLRNHSNKGTRDQEPWAFGAATERILAHYIRTRYKLLPYLYNLFIAQEERGDAILRPLMHDFSDGPGQDLAAVGDQFLVGPALMQAPVLEEGAASRRVVLPPGWWYALHESRWKRGGRTVSTRQSAASTPLYVRENSLIPMQVGERTGNANDLADIELHAFIRPKGIATCTYAWDDGASFDYRKGARSAVRISLAAKDAEPTVEVLASGAGLLKLRVVRHGGGRQRVTLAGTVQRVQVGKPVTAG